MNIGYLFSVRSARLVSMGRALLAVFMVISALLGPRETWPLSEFLIAGNLVWAAIVFGVAHTRRGVYDLLRVAAPISSVDFIIYTALFYATSGADSPFFSPFIVLILAATIQWGARGARIMGALALVALLPAGWQALFGIDQDSGSTQMFVLRFGYTGIITVLLAAFGGHLERVVQELSRLSVPFGEESDDSGPPVQACLLHALAVFRAQRGVLLLADEDEPYATLFLLEGTRMSTRQVSDGDMRWIHADLESSAFLLDSHSRTTVSRSRRDVWPTPLGPLSAHFAEAGPFERALVIPACTQTMKSWVIVLDHLEPAAEDLSVGAMVGAQVSVALERWDSQRSRRAAFAAEERIRLARDLHDGVLQFLAGAGLQMDALVADRRLDAVLRTRVDGLRRSFTDESFELRSFISTLRPARHGAPDRSLGVELQELADRLSRHWSISVETDIRQDDIKAPSDMSYDLSRIVREAVANGVRHGGARRITIRAEAEEGRLHLSVEDDGRGFPGDTAAPDGEHDQDAVVVPRTLGERVRALGGTIEVLSTEKGARVLIDLPLHA